MIADGFDLPWLEYFCFEGDGLWTSADSELIQLAKSEIGKIGLMNPDDVFDACVVRQARLTRFTTIPTHERQRHKAGDRDALSNASSHRPQWHA